MRFSSPESYLRGPNEGRPPDTALELTPHRSVKSVRGSILAAGARAPALAVSAARRSWAPDPLGHLRSATALTGVAGWPDLRHLGDAEELDSNGLLIF